MVESFIASFDTPPAELILDFDATDDAVHGRQEPALCGDQPRRPRARAL
jgi:hypothetical protein